MRAPVPEDAPAVLGVIVARDIADVGVADYALEDLLGEWRGGGLDIGADTIVAERREPRSSDMPPCTSARRLPWSRPSTRIGGSERFCWRGQRDAKPSGA